MLLYRSSCLEHVSLIRPLLFHDLLLSPSLSQACDVNPDIDLLEPDRSQYSVVIA